MTDSVIEPETWTDEWMSANTEVFLAIRNARENPASVIIDFLRSDVPLHPLVREALADAFEDSAPVGSVRLVVQNVPYGPSTPGGRRRQQRDIEIARFVADRRAEGAKRSDAEREAAERFLMSEDQCHKAVTEIKKMEKWISENMPSEAPAALRDRPDLWEALGQQRYLQHLAGKI